MATFALPGVATSRAAAPSSVAVASSSAAPASTSAAAPPAAASSSARPTSTAAAAAPATSSAAAAPASSSAAAPAASTSSAAAAAAPAVSSSAVAPASSSQAAASSSSAAPSSSSVSASSSSVSRLASSTSSASASRSSSSASIAIIDSSSSTSDTGTRTLSGGTIGAIAGGVAGGLVLIALVWTCWRRIKARRERVPPPPPRDMSYNPHSIRRSNSANMLESGLAPGVGMGRQSSYAALLHNTPSEQVSRQPSYYTTYPIATPSTDGSPLNISPEFNPIEDPSLIGAGAGVSAAGMAGIGAGGLVSPGPASPRDTRPRTADSDGPISPQRMSRRIPSVDRLRLEAAGLPIPSDRAPSPSPSTLQFPSPRPAPYPIIEHSPLHSGDITPPSPSVSSTGHPSRSSSSPLLNQGYRPGSMSSLSSRNYLHVGPARGAPHQGRPVQLEMPKPLAKGGDMGDGMGLGSPLAQAGEWKRNSGGPSDFMPYNPNQHRRMPSGQSVSGNSAQSRPRTSQSYAQGLGGTNPGQASPRTMSGGPRPASGPQQ